MILARLAKGFVLGDGGALFELERRGYVSAGPFTPEVSIEHPSALRSMQTDFARAGVDVLQAFTYYAHEENSRRLAEMMGGDIGLISRPGQGNVFYFSAAFEPGEIEQTRAHAPGKMSELFTGSQSLNILLVGPNPINAKVATSFLDKLGHFWVIASTAREAVELYGRGSYDLVLIDIELPESDGLEAAQNIRKIQARNKSEKPIIAMTAQALDQTRDQCIEAGLSDYVTKPLDFYDLDAVILRLVPECGGFISEPEERYQKPAEPYPGLDRKAALLRLGGEEKLLAELSQMFMQEIPGRIEKFGQAFQTGNLPEIQIQAHNLKGVATLVGATKLSRLALGLEQAAKTHSLSEAKPIFSRLKTELDRLKTILA